MSQQPTADRKEAKKRDASLKLLPRQAEDGKAYSLKVRLPRCARNDRKAGRCAAVTGVQWKREKA